MPSWSDLDKAEQRWLRSNIIDLATTLAGPGGWRDEPPDRRFLNLGGAFACLTNGVTCHTSNPRFSPLHLLCALQMDRTEADTLAWIRACRAKNPSHGSCDPDAIPDDEASFANREYRTFKGRDALLRSVAITPDTTSWIYLQSRGLDPNLCPADRFRHLPHARLGDDAMIAVGGDPTDPTCVLLTYLDAYGRKSTVQPQRRCYRILCDKVRMLVLPGAGDEILICEGVENALSIRTVDQRTVYGLFGIGELRRVPVKRGQKFIIVRDGDRSGSEADKALSAGIDEILLG